MLDLLNDLIWSKVLIVALVACQQGLRTSKGAVGVGEATTRTVVVTMVLIYVANYFMTAWLFA